MSTAAIQIQQEGSRYVARFPFSYETKDVVKAAGFRFDPARKVWWTEDRSVVARLAGEEPATAPQIDPTTIPVPAGIDYLPYQRTGIAFALSRDNALIADQMGLGKTVQALGVVNGDSSVRHVLVICPASLKLNWKREAEKWLTRPLSVGVANGSFPETDVVVINYDVVSKWRGAIDAGRWDLLIVDEAHYLKNPKAKRTQAVLGHREKVDGEWRTIETPIRARRRVFLTGTPIVNCPIELWPLVEALDPTGLGRNFFGYAKRYCNAVKGEHGWDFSGSSNLGELQTRLRGSFMIRRLKDEVLSELPAKRRQVVLLEGGKDDQRSMDAEMRVYRDWQAAVESGDTEAQTAAFTEMSKLRHATAVAKIPYVIEAVESALESEDKVVVFAHHHDVIRAMAEAFPGAAVITGETANETRQAEVDRFQSDPACRVFIGSIQAAGVGITLTAAQHVVFAELDWVPGNMSQAEDRLHRIGQRGQVLVSHLVFAKSLDAHMSEVIIGKQTVIDAALDDETQRAAAPKVSVEIVERPQVVEAAPVDEKAEAYRAVVHYALRLLAGVCDGAASLDGQGFNRLDTNFGHSLTHREKLTDKQVAAAVRMMVKYRRQLPSDVVSALYPETGTAPF